MVSGSLAPERGLVPSPQGPLLTQCRLGAEQQRLRDGEPLDEVAVETLISTSKLSRLENGQGRPSAVGHPRPDQLLQARGHQPGDPLQHGGDAVPGKSQERPPNRDQAPTGLTIKLMVKLSPGVWAAIAGVSSSAIVVYLASR